MALNKQGENGIEWLNGLYGLGTGYTWNVAGGCFHQCAWRMPDDTVAQCYAKTVASGLAQHAYPEGFEHFYWHPERLKEPLKIKGNVSIFIDSMSDLMGHWVQDEQIQQVLDVCKKTPNITYFLLTKNARRLPKFTYPSNVWVGASCPPTFMNGNELKSHQQITMLCNGLDALKNTNAAVRWMSFEPLSFDMGTFVESYAPYLEWSVIGAASRGKNYYQPDMVWVKSLLDALNRQATRVFFKGNLRPLAEQHGLHWREDYPVIKSDGPTQMELFA